MTETTFLADLEELEDWLTRINAPVPDIALPTVERAAAQARTLAAIREWAESDTPIPAGDTTQLVAGIDAAKFVVRQILDPPETEE